MAAEHEPNTDRSNEADLPIGPVQVPRVPLQIRAMVAPRNYSRGAVALGEIDQRHDGRSAEVGSWTETGHGIGVQLLVTVAWRW